LASTTGAIRVGEGAVVERIILVDEPEDAVSVARSEVTLAAGSSFSQTVLATGAKRQRIETHVQHPGQAQLRLDGAYLLGGTRHSDQTTVLTHEGLGGVSTQLVKGVAADRARAVFQGKIVVARGADGTDAHMGSHAIILSDRAEVDAKPELEIYADDVQCAHGNTVGALDDEALFYARSRGIPETAARAMLMGAFVGEVVERIGDDAARAIARAWLEHKLGRLA
jgi:Fe-S cluster assembly protein SufD